ncbi:MAG: hypothetical protein ACE5K0_10590 [Candidatus Methanofastidiosia archaeon]
MKDITDFCVVLCKAYQELRKAENDEEFKRQVRIFNSLLSYISEEFGIEQFNFARHTHYLDQSLIDSAYLGILRENIKSAKLKLTYELPLIMSVDMMDCGEFIAAVETNGFTSRGISNGEITSVGFALYSFLKSDRKATFLIGYPKMEGKHEKSDDLLYEKLIYLGALVMRMRKARKNIRVLKEYREVDSDYVIYILPKDIKSELILKNDKVYWRGRRIDYMSDNLTRTRLDLLPYVKSVNPNGVVSDSKHLTYDAIMQHTLKGSPLYPLFSHKISIEKFSEEEMMKEIEKAFSEIVENRGRRVLIKPDKGSGGCGIYISEKIEDTFEKIQESKNYAPDGGVLVMECAPVVPVDLDLELKIGKDRIRAGELLRREIERVHEGFLNGAEVPEEIIHGKHATDVRFYVTFASGKDLIERFGEDALKLGIWVDEFYLYPMGSVIRMAPGVWSEDPRELAQNPSIIKTNISQEVEDKGAKTEYGVLRAFPPTKKILKALGYEKKYKKFMLAAFDAVKATILYYEKGGGLE